MILLADVPSTDPLALIIAAGGACIGGLASIVLLFHMARSKRTDADIKSLAETLNGRDGITVQIATLRGDVNTLKSETASLKNGTLTKDLFERETREQNSKLDDLKQESRELKHQVEKIDRSLGPHQRYDSPPPAPFRAK